MNLLKCKKPGFAYLLVVFILVFSTVFTSYYYTYLYQYTVFITDNNYDVWKPRLNVLILCYVEDQMSGSKRFIEVADLVDLQEVKADETEICRPVTVEVEGLKDLTTVINDKQKILLDAEMELIGKNVYHCSLTYKVYYTEKIEFNYAVYQDMIFPIAIVKKPHLAVYIIILISFFITLLLTFIIRASLLSITHRFCDRGRRKNM